MLRWFFSWSPPCDVYAARENSKLSRESPIFSLTHTTFLARSLEYPWRNGAKEPFGVPAHQGAHINKSGAIRQQRWPAYTMGPSRSQLTAKRYRSVAGDCGVQLKRDVAPTNPPLGSFFLPYLPETLYLVGDRTGATHWESWLRSHWSECTRLMRIKSTSISERSRGSYTGSSGLDDCGPQRAQLPHIRAPVKRRRHHTIEITNKEVKTARSGKITSVR